MRIERNDFELHMLRISDLADSRLQRGDSAARRCLDYVSLPAVHFGDALVDREEIIAQYSNPLRDDGWKLLERMPRIGQLGASPGDLLIERHYALLLPEFGLLAALQLDRCQCSARSKLSARCYEIFGKLQSL